jgi:hypothetical protein
MLARENFEGSHVWYNRKTFPQAGRARQAEVEVKVERRSDVLILASTLA